MIVLRTASGMLYALSPGDEIRFSRVGQDEDMGYWLVVKNTPQSRLTILTKSSHLMDRILKILESVGHAIGEGINSGGDTFVDVPYIEERT